MQAIQVNLFHPNLRRPSMLLLLWKKQKNFVTSRIFALRYCMNISRALNCATFLQCKELCAEFKSMGVEFKSMGVELSN